MLKKVIVAGTIILVGTVVVLFAVYSLLPAKYSAYQHLYLEVDSNDIWSVITTPSKYPEWRSGIEIIEIAHTDSDLLEWKAIDESKNELYVKEVKSEEPFRWVISIIDDSRSYSGSWTFLLQTKQSGTSILITETGTIQNPFYRLYWKFFVKPEAGIESYLNDLSRYFGEEVNF